MRLSELKSLQSLIAAISREVVSFRNVFQEHTASVRDERVAQNESDEEKWENAQKVIACLRPTPEEKATKEANQERRHRQNIGIQRILTLGTWLAFAAAAYYAGIARRQWRTMDSTYNEIVKQTNAADEAAYSSCLNAQAAQANLLLFQKSVSDSHAAALATVKQSQIGIEAERAIISVTPRLPAQENLWSGKLNIPFTVKNEGKSKAFSATLMYRAVLLGEMDDLKISNRNLEGLISKYIPSGSEFPSKPDEPTQKPITVAAQVRDIKDNVILVSSQQAQEFLSGGPEIVVFYGHMEYSDFSGTHRVRFCQPLYIMKPGSFHAATKGESACQKYNHEDDRYNSNPKIGAFIASDLSQIKSINCVEPKR